MPPRMIVVAGPPGSGKSTLYPLTAPATDQSPRGHFVTAALLLERGRKVDPDNVYLAFASTRLLHEQRRFGEAVRQMELLKIDLAGSEDFLLRYATADSLLERKRRTQAVPLSGEQEKLIKAVLRPLNRGDRRSEYLPRFWHRLLAMEAKAYWYGVVPMPPEWNFDTVCRRLLTGERTSPLLGLASRIHWASASRDLAVSEAKEACEKASTDELLVAQNALGSLYLLDNNIDAAEQILRGSLEIDRRNTYTLLLWKKVLLIRGKQSEAELVAAQVNDLRGETDLHE